MSIDLVRAYLEPFGLADRVRELPVSSATVELAAAALGTEPARIAKTISLRLKDGCLLLLAAGDARIDNARFKAEFHTKAAMLPASEVEVATGHPVGGVCPFAVKEGVRTFLDESLKRFQTVFPACGSGNSAIELTLSELERYSGFEEWVDVCKSPEG